MTVNSRDNSGLLLARRFSWRRFSVILCVLLVVILPLASCGGGGKVTTQVQQPPKYSNVTPQSLAPHNTNVITATASAGGTISPSGTVIVQVHTDKTFSISPDDGYKITDVKVDGASVGALKTYTFKDVYADHTIAATFEKLNAIKIIYVISATAGPNGTVSPAGQVNVSEHASQTFTISPANGFRIADVQVDGVSVGAVGTYTFNDVTANHAISATFTATGPASLYDGTYQGTLTYTYRIYKSTDALGNPNWGPWLTASFDLTISLKTTEVAADAVTVTVTHVICSEPAFGATGDGVTPLNESNGQSSTGYLPVNPPLTHSDLSIVIVFPNGAVLDLWNVNASSDGNTLYNIAADTASSGAWNFYNVPSGDLMYFDNPPTDSGSEFQFADWTLIKTSSTVWGIPPVQ